MMLCPVVHVLHDQYFCHEVVSFPLHLSVQKQSPGDLKNHQEVILYSPLTRDTIKPSFLQNTPRVLVANASNKLSLVTTVRLNL
jgi:hypothetical protein